MTAPIVLDIETQNAFQDVAGDIKKLKISLVGIYDYARDVYETYLETELDRLFPLLEHAEFTIGFNINNFDFPVLSSYYLGKISQFPTLDIIEEVEKILGFRIALDDLASATIGAKKSGHGFMAINYFKRGEFEKLKAYCLDDVKITKELYEYGKKEKKLYFNSRSGKREIKVAFDTPKKDQAPVSLSIPF